MKMRMDEKEEEVEEEKTFECSSGCQSGWTMYLDHSYGNPMSLPFKKAISMVEDDDEEEDLSMVSDASSGPPHFHEDDEHCYCGNGCFCSASSLLPSAALVRNGGKKRRVEAEHQPTHKETSPSFLDDTASSPFFSFSKTSCNATTNNNKKKKLSVEDVLELSCGFSATKFEGKSALQKHLGYLQASAPVKPASVCREGEKKLW